MNQKKRFFISKKAQEIELGADAYKWIIMIILAILLGLFLFMVIMRWTNVFKPQ